MKPSPFKFLDAYQEADIDIFFGREKETEALYDALSGVKHLLVYGPSGAGKTSLIECGLRNQFSDADWFALTIRKGVNITGSFYTAINSALADKIPLDDQHLPQDEELTFEEAIEQLFATAIFAALAFCFLVVNNFLKFSTASCASRFSFSLSL